MSTMKFGRRELFKRAALTGVGLGVAGTAAGTRTVNAQSDDVPLADKVPTKKLGTTGYDIPILLMGGATKFDPTFDRMLHRAHKDGMFYIDTAEAYASGQSHKGIGVFVEQIGRENVWITSKSGEFGNPVAPVEQYKSTINRAMDELKTDYLDMYMMHGIEDPGCLGPEYIKMGQDMKKSGFAKLFGFSCHGATVVELLNKAAKIGTAGIDAVMFKYNFTEYGNAELNKAIDACKEAGIGVIGMKAQTSVPDDDKELEKFTSKDFTLAQAKLKAVWADERIDSCVSGITNLRHLKENSTAARSAIQLSMNDLMQLNQYAARTAHLRCQFCDDICESKIDGDTKVAKMLRYLMYDECYGNPEEARRLYNALTPLERQVAGIDFSAATAACPQGIDIASRLVEARRHLA